MINYPQFGETLKDKVILITGAGDGIGKAVAIACAKQGAQVILSGRSKAKLNQTYDEISSSCTNNQAIIYPLDLLKLDDKAADLLVGGIYNEFGRLDGLVHNAAILGNLSPFEQTPTQSWQNVFQVNVHAPFILSKFCLPLLLQSKAPSIIFTGSGAGKTGIAYWGAYSASKFANESMTQVLALELEMKGIKVNMVDPLVVRTKMRALAFPAEDPNTLPTPEQITDVYIYLLSEDSLGISNQRLDAWVK